MTSIRCFTPEGNPVLVEEKNIVFRPAAYGILIEQGVLFLLRQPETGLLYPPGGLVAAHETPAQHVRTFFRQLTGMMPLLGPMLFVEQRYEVLEGKAWQLSVMYYALERPSASAMTPAGNQQQTEWIALSDLRREQLQFGYEAIQAARLRLQLVNGG